MRKIELIELKNPNDFDSFNTIFIDDKPIELRWPVSITWLQQVL